MTSAASATLSQCRFDPESFFLPGIKEYKIEALDELLVGLSTKLGLASVEDLSLSELIDYYQAILRQMDSIKKKDRHEL